jgi:hypothetical protein
MGENISKLTITHNAGFFSCCTIRLIEIIKFFNENGKLPDVVDSSKQFEKYKVNKQEDLTTYFFNQEKLVEDLEKIDFPKGDN